MRSALVRRGRSYIVRFDHGEDLNSGLKKFVSENSIKTATVTLLGAIEKGELVTGPERPVLPAEPHWVRFENVWELFGTGIITFKDGEVSLHIHSSLGKDSKTLVGCLRKEAMVFVTVEAFIQEIITDGMTREFDATSGCSLLSL
ncbi:MAG: DNA-binding protein [Candidatus Omnitrophica bacterium]|nr:DNA-binding protein [Candidatus Omnitrophota bacterium]